ncbi:zonadhesin-like [Catharus ustulatus]|uniref:zonadhesin-like n=1 Tax=Catharus ustulatus TaxID=91951 RepID=UPI001408F2FA|nr:zonadhesin-like [Catharus ustulatus]
MSHCGCSHHGVYYKEGETFYPTEQEMCQCPSGGTVECQNTSCPDGGPGKVIDGVFQCPLEMSSTCVATGDRTYVTFDGMAFNMTGTCSYVITQTCTGDSMTSFIVTIQKEAWQKRKVSRIQALSVEVYGVTLTLKQGKRIDVMVDSISHHLPTIVSEGQVQVYPHGTGVLLRPDLSLIVHYDLVQLVMVTVPQTYMGHLCDLCGSYNGQHNDDFQLSSGQLAPDATAFGSAWKTTPALVPPAQRRKWQSSKNPTTVESEGPFGSGHRIIEPIPYSQSCIHDLCMMGGDRHVPCQSMQSYVTACQDAGVTVGAWRTPSFCYSCKSLHCRPKERCWPHNAQSHCIPTLVAMCWTWGDPHFRTFYGLNFDFQRTCTYTIAESHRNGPGLVPFRIEAKNDIRGGIQSVSYVSLVRVDVYGQRISFRQNEDRRVWVNGGSSLHPQPAAPGVPPWLHHPDMGVTVTFDCTFDGHLGNSGESCTLLLLELERGEPEEELEPITVALEQEDTKVQWVMVMAQGVTMVMDRGQQWEVTWMVQGAPKILYDGNTYVVLTLPPASYRPRGLCGNFNGDPNDDDPDGEALAAPRLRSSIAR